MTRAPVRAAHVLRMEQEILLVQDQAGHVGTDGRMKAKLVRQKTHQQREQQDRQAGMLAAVGRDQVARAVLADHRDFRDPAGQVVRQQVGAGQCDHSKEGDGLADGHRQAERAQCRLPGSNRHQHGNQRQRRDVVKHRGCHDAGGGLVVHLAHVPLPLGVILHRAQDEDRPPI